jgi:hypothetical protein
MGRSSLLPLQFPLFRVKSLAEIIVSSPNEAIMIKHPLQNNLGHAMMDLLGALSLLMLLGCALPYSPQDLPLPTRAVTGVLSHPALRIPAFLAGLTLLLSGLWLAELIIAIPGFVIGAVIGASIGSAANDGQFGILSFLLAIVAGAVFARLVLALFYLGVFFSGFVIGFVAGVALGTVLFHSQEAATTIGIVLGIMAGIVAAVLWQYLKIVISSGVGAILIGAALGITDKPALLILIWLGGIAAQSVLLKVFGPPKKNAGPGGGASPASTTGSPPASGPASSVR